MFFFGLSSSILPFIISFVVICAYILLGYGNFICVETNPGQNAEKTIHFEIEKPSMDASIAQFPQQVKKIEIQKNIVQSDYFSFNTIFPHSTKNEFFLSGSFHPENGHFILPENKAPPEFLL